MRIVRHAGAVHPDRAPFDAAERKGIGHPDSLADLVADSVTHAYSRTWQQQYGVVPRHSVDTVNLVGAAADVRFGGFEINKPVDCYLAGELAERTDGVEIPVREVFAEAVRQVLATALDDESVADHVRLFTADTATDPTDGDHRVGSLSHGMEESAAKDTILCAGTSTCGIATRVAVWLESTITAPDFRSRYPTGTDVTALVVRDRDELTVTVAIPFHPGGIASWAAYDTLLHEIRDELCAELKRFLEAAIPGAITTIRLQLNTSDAPDRSMGGGRVGGCGGFLAPFGSSLGMGDCGAVVRDGGRDRAGERSRPALRGGAGAAKSRMYHVRNLYTSIACDAARRLLDDLGVYAEVVIAARDGERLYEPAFVLISTEAPIGSEAESLVASVIATGPLRAA